MSYIRSTIKCEGCGREMNVAFGIVGRTQIAGWPSACPDCGSDQLTEIASGWHARDTNSSDHAEQPAETTPQPSPPSGEAGLVTRFRELGTRPDNYWNNDNEAGYRHGFQRGWEEALASPRPPGLSEEERALVEEVKETRLAWGNALGPELGSLIDRLVAALERRGHG